MRKLSMVASALMLALFSSPGQAASWTIDQAASSIQFSGTHAGKAFTGRFGEWAGVIEFDPEALDKAKAEITVTLASAKTGDAAYDSTLTQADWLGPDKAIFAATNFTRTGDKSYLATGSLSLKGLSVPVALPFDLVIDGTKATATGKLTFDRKTLRVGLAADGAGDWVSLEIPVEIKVVATRQ